LFNPSHVLGIFSTCNDDAMGGATLYKGPFPAMFGGASSSVLETSLSVGDFDSFHGSGTVGILAAKIKAEGPIVRDRLAFAVSARRSYVDAFLKMVPKYKSTIMNFYDATAKLRWRISPTQTLDGSFFIGKDNMAVASLMGFYWGNTGAALKWSATKGEHLTFNTAATFTHYSPEMSMDIMDMDQTYKTYIRNYALSEKVLLTVSDRHNVEVGLKSELIRVKSAEWAVNTSHETEVRSLWDNALWADYNGRFGERVEAVAGLRLNAASVLSQPRFHEFSAAHSVPNEFSAKTYLDVEPRLSFKYNLNDRNNLKAGFGISTQNIHSIRMNTTSFPSDRCALTSATVKPEHAVQWALGYAGMTRGGDFDWSAELYYRDLDNVYDLKDGKSIMSDIALENIILGGRGRSCGGELMVRKNTGALTGWISYTLSRTQTKIPGINDGRWYNASNDRRHDISVTAVYSLTKRWNVSASWIFLSGQPLTAPDVKYEVAGVTCYYYSGRNTYKTPPTHRLDLSATYSHPGKKVSYEWNFGIYNAYCRYNPYIVYFEDDPSKPSGTRAVQQALYGLIPSVSYTIKF
ncbi:MAG: outer membrane beta-barrel protein, partial [Muribaculaceae bacterium]|nr:outer membrane beta-barrel protein [Muribaculaceae bacterium]